MRSAVVARVLVTMGLLPLVPACVGPARSFGSYEGKAGATAQAMHSTVQTARLAVSLAGERKATAPYVSEMLHYAEDDATSIQGAFDSIQPPDAASDRLRAQLDGYLSTAVDTIAGLRIAARRGDQSALGKIAAPLPEVSKGLDTFVTRHPPGGPS
jgi:hypothetical protein